MRRHDHEIDLVVADGVLDLLDRRSGLKDRDGFDSTTFEIPFKALQLAFSPYPFFADFDVLLLWLVIQDTEEK